MPAVHVRNVPEETVARLKERAALHGRSLEAELRLVLDDAARTQPQVRRRRRPLDESLMVNTGIVESFDRHDIYGDDDPDGR
jgi:plasmid stability protein